MGTTKGRALTTLEREPEQATEEQARGVLNDVVFFALPTPLFNELSNAAAKRQMTLSQLLSTAVSVYLSNTEPKP